ncbi:MFS transporter [Waterburya agarophytonicola K14]|uniref:MFS transporter n=1 Tax=Waterburya agarophytonicola KI4 TaxID=2874699 RepID=A0A964C0Q4_9CYAN|nr:MFS transporter [Waterburya agarophytonicola]MCC0179555.1 MFS transporter [Waterburya agarophytonicola KI4]
MNRWALLASLYVAQFLPVAFFGQTLPVFLRQQGVSLELVGLTSLLSLPWTLKVLWSPLIDRYGWTKWGHYKFWIVLMQSLMGIVITVCALLDFDNNFMLLLAMMLLAITFAATQDIATDALAVDILKPSERGLGNSIQVGGGYLGSIIGGGVILIALDTIGWQNSLLLMALGVFALIFPVIGYRESKSTPKAEFQLSLRSLTGFFRQSKIPQWILILVVYMMGVTIASTMSRPLLVDLNLSLSDIGLMNGIVSFSAGFVGAFVGGFLLKYLGRKRGLIIFGILIAVAIALWILPTVGYTSLPILYLCAAGLQFTYAMACVPMFAICMDNSRQGNAGFDYTLQITIIFIGSLLAGSLSGFLAESLGYWGAFAIASLLSLVGVLLTGFLLE